MAGLVVRARECCAPGGRLERLGQLGVKLRRQVLTTGGGDGRLAKILRRDWKGRWTFRSENEATLGGAWVLAESARS